MWAIRFLSGAQAGQIIKLKSGKNTMGRGDRADLRINNSGVSKEHLELHCFVDKVVVTDLDSSNGSFLNGVRIQSAVVKLGDKLNVHDVLFELIKAPAMQAINQLAGNGKTENQAPSMISQFKVEEHVDNQNKSSHDSQSTIKLDISTKFQNYINQVLLPGIYHLTDIFEYKHVLIGFSLVFILLVTLLSVLPMKQITSESIETESRRRAQTVARALANANEKVIRFGDLSNFSTDFVLREDGIEDVYIVSKDGMILAPPERVGSRPKDVGFLRQIQGQAREISSAIGDHKVAAAYPIVSFDSELQQNIPKAHAVVVFNIASLQFDDGRAFSLFIQMLIISSLLGLILFYFVYKLVEYPFVRLNEELDSAVKENKDHTELSIKLPALQQLMVNINSLLNRALHQQNNVQISSSHSRDQEMQNLCEMIGYPCLIVNKSGVVLILNSGFESLTGFLQTLITGTSVQNLPDQALQKNMTDLMSQAQVNSGKIFSDHIELSGHQVHIHCQGILGFQSHENEYYIFTFTPREQSEGGAA